MIRTTAEASNTRLRDFSEATSTLPVLADQRFWRWLKCITPTLCRQSSQLGKRLSTPLTRIATTGLLQIHQGLLAQTAVSAMCPQLQEVMQRIRQVADLKGGHEAQAVGKCILLAPCMQAMTRRGEVSRATRGPGHCSSGEGLRQRQAKPVHRFSTDSVQTAQVATTSQKNCPNDMPRLLPRVGHSGLKTSRTDEALRQRTHQVRHRGNAGGSSAQPPHNH